MPAPEGTRITIRLPDDFHQHCRDGHKTAAILSHATRRFGRCLMMPDLVPPVTTTDMALQYKQHIQSSLPPNAPSTFTPQYELGICQYVIVLRYYSYQRNFLRVGFFCFRVLLCWLHRRGTTRTGFVNYVQ